MVRRHKEMIALCALCLGDGADWLSVGKDFRWITSGEYIQMSGRAGRRGKDDSGIVIQMVDEKIEPDICKGESHSLWASIVVQ